MLAVNLGACALLAWGLTGEYARHREMKGEIARLEGQVSRMETENYEISQLARRLSSAESLEREARLNLGLRRPGEQVVIVSPSAPAAPTEEPAAKSAPASRSGLDNAVKWWQHYFGNN